MIFKLFNVGLLIMCVAGFISCKKEFFNGSNRFNSVGTKFTYLVTDSAAKQTATVTVRIVSKIEISGKLMNVWAYDYPNTTDTNYVFSDRDSIIVYDHTKAVVKTVYYLPLTIGSKWQNYHYSDTCYVINKVNITSAGETYNDVYQINEKASGFNYSLNKTEWFLPGTGLIKMSEIERNLGPSVSYEWELVKIE